ncbi:MAG: ATPase [Alphaproteobacteria bacterium]|nr:ATPase [Alphaproteobacteria bacterium]
MAKTPKSSRSDAEQSVSHEEAGNNAKARRLPKRFYKMAQVHPENAGFAVRLDGRTLRTPAHHAVVLPTEALAAAVAKEWQSQGDVIDPGTMPLTKLCNSTLDGVVPKRQMVIEDIAKYAGHDAICYRSEDQTGLAAKQVSVWDPIINWAEAKLGVRWRCTGGVMPVTQSPEANVVVQSALDGFGPFQLASLHEMTVLTGSALLPLAYADDVLDLETLWSAANLDENWQIATWGEDGEAKARREARWADLQAADRLFALSTVG